MSPAIRVEGLVKRYGDMTAVQGLDLTVEHGEIVGFLGSNGAGKTTTIEILEGFRTRTAGTVEVLGQDPATAPLAWREDIGIVLQESQIEPEFTCLEALRMHSACFSKPLQPHDVLELVGLESAKNQRAAKLSGGQLRRLDLALALIGDPKLVFLDEPTTGFDPSARRDSWAMISGLRDRGHTVLLTTHYMDEAETLSDRIVIVDKGAVVAEGTPAQLAVEVGAVPRIEWKTPAGIPRLPDGFGAFVDGPDTVIETHDVFGVLAALTLWASDNNAQAAFDDLRVLRPTLESSYLRLVSA